MQKIKIKKITTDVFYNLLASAIPTFFLQLIIHPFMNRILGNMIYGDMLTILSYVNICLGMFGSSLNNTRLLENDNYTEPGDFTILLIGSLSLSAVLQAVFSILYGFRLDILGSLMLLGYNLCMILVSCYSVEFRIHLSYRKIFLAKVCHTAGYIIGAVIFYFTHSWQFIFFAGVLFELVFVLFNTKIWREPVRKSKLFSSTAKRLAIFIGSTALTLIVTYADRLIIYPAFGSEDVSIYYSATVIGKAVLLATNPIGGVLLTYVAKMKEIRRKDFVTLAVSISFIAAAGYFIANFLSHPLIKILYPNCYPDALALTPITNATVMIGLIYSFCWPVVFKFGGKTSPLFITAVRMISYLLIAIIGIPKLGIYSICYGNLISTCLQAFMVLILGIKSSKKTVKNL